MTNDSTAADSSHLSKALSVKLNFLEEYVRFISLQPDQTSAIIIFFRIFWAVVEWSQYYFVTSPLENTLKCKGMK